MTASAPAWTLFATEPLRGTLDHLAGWLADDRPWPRGDGRPVIVYPGLATNERATSRLRITLERLGYEVRDWGGGLNRGPGRDVESFLGVLDNRLSRLTEQHGRPAALIGWSLGGLYARELARRAPKRVSSVITLGTPIRPSPGATRVAPLYALLNGEPARFDPGIAAQLAQPLPVPTVSVYSRHDGVVSWESCLVSGAGAQNIEVPGVSHLGLVAHPSALEQIAHALASSKRGSARLFQN